MSSREWMSQYNAAKRDIVTKRQTGRPIGAGDVRQLNNSLATLEKDLKTMASSPMEYELSAAEIARRQVILDNLKKQIQLLLVSGSPLTGMSTTNAPPTTGPGDASLNPLNNASTGGLVQRQQEVIKMQDSLILEIGVGVDRLHGQALQIGEEAKSHNQILEQLDTQVDHATEGLREEAKHAQQINDQTRMCSYYICVALEVVIIVVLLIFMLGVK